VWGQARRNLIDFFGKDKPIDAITPGDADQWRLSLIDQGKLADNTVRRRCGIAKQFFNFARRKRLIAENRQVPAAEEVSLPLGNDPPSRQARGAATS
jgi:hypothetical protein